jgi:hypothetical protein
VIPSHLAEAFPDRPLGVGYGLHLTAVLDDWDPRIVDGLAAKHHVIVFDNRGVGGSGGSFVIVSDPVGAGLPAICSPARPRRSASTCHCIFSNSGGGPDQCPSVHHSLLLSYCLFCSASYWATRPRRRDAITANIFEMGAAHSTVSPCSNSGLCGVSPSHRSEGRPFFQALQEVVGRCLAVARLGKEKKLLRMLIGGACLAKRIRLDTSRGAVAVGIAIATSR